MGIGCVHASQSVVFSHGALLKIFRKPGIKLSAQNGMNSSYITILSKLVVVKISFQSTVVSHTINM